MNATHPTSHSLRYRQVAADAWVEVIRPHLVQHRPELLDGCFYGLGSSVAYGLADEHSDIDTVLVVPEDELAERRDDWINWAYRNPDLLAFSMRHGVDLNVKITTWQQMGAALLYNRDGDWQEYYEGHHHYVSTLIPIHDPQSYIERIRRGIVAMPTGLAETAIARLEGELASLAVEVRNYTDTPRFAGLLAYAIVARALPLLFHRARAPLPFHKWQWPLAERLGAETNSVLIHLQHLLDHQQNYGGELLPKNLIPKDTRPVPWRVSPIPVDNPLSAEFISQALASVQWHLEERGCYQMTRSLARGWRHEARYYLCATRCLLIKGAVLLETGCLPLGKNIPAAWEAVHAAFPGLEGYLWPEPDEDPITKTLEAIGLFRAHLRLRSALPELYLARPLWSPPSYKLACVLEEP